MATKTFRIPFSRIRTDWLRRSMMLIGYPVMLACNWLLILLAAALSILQLALAVLIKAIAAPFQLAGESFTEAWHGRGPGSDQSPPTKKGSVMKKHILDKPILRDVFWFFVLPYRLKQHLEAKAGPAPKQEGASE